MSNKAIRLFKKQSEFFSANNRINVYIGGIQSGKSTVGAVKMAWSLMQNQRSEDNFIIAADTYKTLSQATIPRFMKFGRHLGKLQTHLGEFKLKSGGTIYLRTATDPDSIEGITNVRRIWLDEGGKVSKYFFENVMGRAAFLECPIDITTTPYALNWLADLCKQAQGGKRDDVNIVECRSIDSPYFPKDEFKRQKKLLDPRRFAMKYEGKFGKMEGLVYDKINLCPSFALPTGTRYFGACDWGYSPDPFCFVIRAVTPDGMHYRIFEYYKTFLTISDIVNVVKGFHGIYNFELIYCDPSQPAHIEELNRHNIPAVGADNQLRYGIDKHYELIKTERFWVFEDLNPLGIDEYNMYHYPEPKELGYDESHTKKALLPVDATNHGCDCDRYLSVELEKSLVTKRIPRAAHSGEAPKDLAKRIEWLKRGGSSRYSSVAN